MGTDIHVLCETQINDQWVEVHTDFTPFDWRSYGLFGFLANVRNYSHVPFVSDHRGYPEGSSWKKEERMGDGYHGASYVTFKELLDFDYDQMFEDRRCMRNGNGAADSGPGKGTWTSIRDFLGQAYFDDLRLLEQKGIERLVFDFDC